MRRFDALAIVGFVAMGLGVVAACGGLLAASEASPPVDGATPTGDADGPRSGPLPRAAADAGDAGDRDASTCVKIPNDDVSNCGGCGTVCSLPNAVPKCTGTQCSVQSCLPDFVDCDGDPTNGCECPSDSCLPGKLCGKRVFVTSTVSNGNLGGLAGADAKCQERALAAVPTLPGTYKAWLSDDVASPSTRFTKAAISYRLVSGTLIANDWIDLTDGTLTNPINLDESGAAAPTRHACGIDIYPWTWTTPDGKAVATLDPGQNCTNWTVESGLDFAVWGSGNKRIDWSWACSGGSCGELSPLFCFQQ